MKKLLLPIVIICTYAITGMTQAPEKFSYQAVIRNAMNDLVTDQSVGLRISIRQNTAGGTIVYQETHTAMTNINGLVSLEVGGGTQTMGTFAGIDWGNGPYYIQTEIDPTGGTSYNIVGATELISVPYALYAANSPAAPSGPFYVGLDTLGGVVFYVHTDAMGNQRGLIVATEDQSAGTPWSNLDNTVIGASAQSSWDGASNTTAITGQAGHTGSAASLCTAYMGGGFNDWYLPSIDELSLLWQNRYEVHKTFAGIGGTNLVYLTYWSSTEFSSTSAWFFNFLGNDLANTVNKFVTHRVRAVRAFSYSPI